MNLTALQYLKDFSEIGGNFKKYVIKSGNIWKTA